MRSSAKLRLATAATALSAVLVFLAFALEPARAGAPGRAVQTLAPPPILGQLSPFELVSSDGTRWESSRLRARPHVLHLFASSMQSLATIHLANLQTVAQRLAGAGLDVGLLSVDISEVSDIRNVRGVSSGSRVGAPGPTWRVREGSGSEVAHQLAALVPTELARTCGCGLKTPEAVAHAGLAVLVDQTGAVRGYYDVSRDDAEVRRLVQDAACLESCGLTVSRVGPDRGRGPL